MKSKKEPIKYRVDISWSDEDRCYVARVPELPGCVTDGSTLEEAAAHARELAIRANVDGESLNKFIERKLKKVV